jgi:ribokinase
MTRFVVSGLINIETTLKVTAFPVTYEPTRYPFFGIQSTVSGVGYNIAKALTVLGHSVDFLSLIGGDLAGRMVREALAADSIPGESVLANIADTAQAVILYDADGKRAIFTDLKDIQERAYPSERAARALAACDVAVLCNINFSRPLLRQAREAGKLIATDVHAIASLDDDYNRDYMAAADILFMSNERLPCSPAEWLKAVLVRFAGVQIAVVGMGGQGAMLATREDGYIGHFPAVTTRPVVNTIGAGDALFSAFLHHYSRNRNPYEALKRAMLFASYKIGAVGAADGFLSAEALEQLSASRML